MLNTHRLLLVWAGVIGLSSCVAPGVQGPGGTVQGTANVENLERQSSVTPAPNDVENAANAAIYGRGGYRYPGYYYPGCRWGRCYRPYGWY